MLRKLSGHDEQLKQIYSGRNSQKPRHSWTRVAHSGAPARVTNVPPASRRSPTQPPFSTLQRCSTKPSPSLPCLLSNSFRSGPIQFLLSFSLLQTSGISQFEMMEKSNC